MPSVWSLVTDRGETTETLSVGQHFSKQSTSHPVQGGEVSLLHKCIAIYIYVCIYLFQLRQPVPIAFSPHH